MAKFIYSLQGILDIKMKMETQAKQEFSEAAGVLNDENVRLESCVERKKFLEDEGEALLKGRLDFRKISDNKLSLSLQDERIALQKDRVKTAEKNMEKAREKLSDVMIDRKTYESLREKAFENFLMEENRAESKMVDELTSYTYGQNKKNQSRM